MRYFAYGSNMNSERMRKREINFLKREYTILKGWRLEFNKIASRNPKEGYANILRDKISVVEGILYTVQESEIRKLDEYEGYPNHYERIKVRVILNNKEEMEAITYKAKSDKVRKGLKPSKEYLDHLLKGCDLLSEEYCERLRRWGILD